MKEKIYEKYAWIIFFLIGGMTLISGIFHGLGINSDPALVESIVGMTIDDLKISNSMFFDLYNFYFRSGGISDVGFAFLLIAISVTAYKRGEKWAWYTFWAIPAFFLSFVGLSLNFEGSASLIPPLIVIIILSLLGLILPFKKFFPSK